MQVFHAIAEKTGHLKNIRYNMKRSRGIRRDLTEQFEIAGKENEENNLLTFKRGDAKYLKQIENLHLELFRQPLYPWLVWLYRFRAKELTSVVVDKNDRVIAYDLFFFQPVEAKEKIIHELYVGVNYKYQDKGIGVKLRQYSSKCYDEGYLDGISTLAAFDNIKALRTAQKSGFAITKTSAKPLAHYLYKHLTRRY